nr:MAG TPA_asm: hypothetical protein [Caudoviricetes sp.]
MSQSPPELFSIEQACFSTASQCSVFINFNKGNILLTGRGKYNFQLSVIRICFNFKIFIPVVWLISPGVRLA